MIRRVLPWACVTLLVLAVLLAGLRAPVRPASVRTDALGPDSGELVADYLTRAAGSLDDPADGQAPRWALVSFTEPIDVGAVAELTGGAGADMRVAQLLFRVPIDRVQTPLVTVAVPQNPEALRRAPAVAAARLQIPASGDDRAARVAAVSAERLAAGCACVVGLVVRASPAQLHSLRSEPGARAVEALPADAVAGRFAVSPLLPEQVDVVAPGPDDGEP